MPVFDQAFADRLALRLSELETRLSSSASVPGGREFRALLREHARLKRLLEQASIHCRLTRDLAQNNAIIEEQGTDAELLDLARSEIETLREQILKSEQELTFALLPPDPNDGRNAIVEIRAGTGGEEAALFAADLYRMYTRFADSHGWKHEMLDASISDAGGYKEVVFSVQGEDAFRLLRFEAGTHRVQRVPETEAQGRIHTSAATVAVLPEAEEMDAIEIRPEDLRVDVYRASGAGGQHVNKTDSAVRLTHLPTGIVVQSQDERSQHRNRDKAMRQLRSRLLAARQQEEFLRTGDARRAQIGSGDRSERIRTYNFPQNRLTDHRIHLTLYALERVMEGDLNEVAEGLLQKHIQTRLAREGLAELS